MKDANAYRAKASLVIGCVVLVLGMVSHTWAQTVLIDWNYNASSAVSNPAGDGKHWNSISGNLSTEQSLLDSSSNSVPWTVIPPGKNQGGTAINGPAGPDPFDEANAIKDGIYANTTSDHCIMTFTNLTASAEYQFAMIGGRASSGHDGVVAVTTGTGTGGILLNDGTVLEFGVTSDETGTIVLDFANSVNIASTTLNAMSISEGSGAVASKPGSIIYMK